MLRLPAEVMEEWEKSEKFMQDTLSPLLNHINALSSCKKGEAPTRRLAIIQVGACGCGNSRQQKQHTPGHLKMCACSPTVCSYSAPRL
jgi:hypothetical protein